MGIEDIERWARGSGLEILLIALGAVLLTRFARYLADRWFAHATLKSGGSAVGLPVAGDEKHKRVLIQMATWTSAVVIYFVAGLLVLQRFNVPLTSIVAPATVIGAAVGFGSQRLVQDLLSGFLIFAEHQYGYGDVVRIAQPGDDAGITGTVEEVTLRTTKLRTLSGELVILPNGEIRQVINMSKDWAQVILDIPLPADTDLSEANEILHRISDEIATDEAWASQLLDAPTVMGVEKLAIGLVQLRFVVRTLPGAQWAVGRELRGRVAGAFREAGIVVQPSLFSASGAAGA